jgi:ABC-type antimicrobial peptide transport system permease subunit
MAEAEPMVYVNYWQQDRANNWTKDSRTHVRVAGDAAAIVPRILRALAEVDPDVPVSDLEPLSARIDAEFTDLRTARAMFATFGMLTLVLSAIGLYAALAFAVGQRTREIAIRMALGAARVEVGRLVLQRGVAVVLLGVAVGLAATTGTGPLLAHMLYGVEPRDPLTLVAGPAVLIVIALLACLMPARRAMGMDPIAALRSE